MPSSLLASKLQVPPLRHKHIPRSRLHRLLDVSGVRKLTLVCAPAGYGKTSLLADWVRTTEVDVCIAWVTLDETDNAAKRFWTYLLAAFGNLLDDSPVDSLNETMQQWLELAEQEAYDQDDVAADILVTRIVNRLIDECKELALVLDDYHVITNPSIHKAVNKFIENAPPTFHFILNCRSEPDLPLSRLRARGELVEIRSEDLRFQGEEIPQYLREVMDVDLAASDADTLEKRTEGWIAGLQLAALSLKGKRNVSDFIEKFTGTDRYVLDYLTEEVLMRQDETTQNFLLMTSILSRLTPSLCDAVTGQTDGARQLERLERKNLFITSLDNQREWYRYHAFFADLLRYRLEQARPDLLPELHRSASLWFAANAYPAEALQHAVAARDVELASSVIEDHPKADLIERELRVWLGLQDSALGLEDLIAEALQHNISADQRNRLFAALEQTRTPTPVDSPLDEPLSDRELEVLTLIAAGYANKAIAKRLDISLNTVKTHTKNINSKLGVSSRVQASARAQALGLL
jgi:LuxR family maltose regulon positive regulatory protein